MRSTLDTVLDRTFVLGYTRPGYALRRRSWPDGGQPPRLDGRTVAVTGATSGLGTATAEALHGLGARVVLVVRSRERGEQLAADLRRRPGARGRDGNVRVVLCDLSSLDSVRHAAAELLATEEHLDVLVNNAGVMPPERTLSPDGIELTFATNVVGPFLLTNLLQPALARASARQAWAGRVITVSSGGMYGQRIHVDDLEMASEKYDGVTAYARSKRAQVILTGLWAQRWATERIGVHAMHPGWADTQGVRDSLPRFYRVTKPLLRTPQQGADTTVWLAGADPTQLPSGRFWHDRRPRPTHLLRHTQEDESDRVGLWRRLSELTGWAERTPAGQSHR